jgi:putative redox protein
VSRQRTADLVSSAGGFDVVTSSGSSGHFGDPANGAFSPMDAVLAALGACTAMDVTSIIAKKRLTIERYVVRVVAEQRDEHPRVYKRIDVSHELEGTGLDVTAVRRSIELSAGRYCPVSAMLAAGPTEIHHHYVVRGKSPEPWEAAGEVLVTGPDRPLGTGVEELASDGLLEADRPGAANGLAPGAGPEAGEQ